MKKIFSKIFIVIIITIFTNSAYSKPSGWKYLGSDIGGAISWGATGAAGGHIGIALGIVCGGLGTSAWDFHWDQKSKPGPGIGSDDNRKLILPVDLSILGSEYNKVGEMHNEFIVSYINSFSGLANFEESFYPEMLNYVSDKYSVSKESISSVFTKEAFKILCNNFEGGIENNFNSSNETVNNYFINFMTNIQKFDFHDKKNVVSFINKEISEVDSKNQLNEQDKLIVNYGLRIAFYSYNLWELNLRD